MASALLNTAQQVGGSLGTALLNTLFAGAVTAYLADNLREPGATPQQLAPLAFVHGYHVAFFWGAVLLAAALARRGRSWSTPRRTTCPTKPGMAG